MPIISETSFSELTNRMDAEYFHPTYIGMEKLLKGIAKNQSFQTVPLRDLSIRIKKGIFSILKSDYTKKGVPLIRVSNIKNLTVDKEELTYISEERNEKEQKTCFYPKDIVISKGGMYVGQVALIPPSMPKANISQDVIGLSVKSKNALPEYICVYLNSRFGQWWFGRNRSRITQPHLELQPIRELPVPVPSLIHQSHVQDLVTHALRLWNEANDSELEAKQLFLDSVGLDVNITDNNVLTVNFSDLIKYHRFDAEFFKPRYVITEALIREREREGTLYTRKLSELGTISKGIEIGTKSYHDEEGCVFLRVSNISEYGIKNERSARYIRKTKYSDLALHYQPKRGEVLYSKDGTIGVSMVVEDGFPQCIISGGIVRITPKRGTNAFYLAYALNSPVCRYQAERLSVGTIIKHLPMSDLKNLRVPFVSEDKQHTIAELYEISIKKKRTSKTLVEQATTYVENLLELSAGDIKKSDLP